MKKLLVVLLGLASLNIYAADPVTRGALQNNPALCQYGYNPNCTSSRQYQQNQPTEIINIEVPSKYMALAMNMKTGMSGGALDMDSRAAAEREAIRTCERGGSNAPCKILAWARNGCIASAQGDEGRRSRLFTVAAEPGLTETKALRRCQNAGAHGCEIFLPETCSLPKF